MSCWWSSPLPDLRSCWIFVNSRVQREVEKESTEVVPLLRALYSSNDVIVTPQERRLVCINSTQPTEMTRGARCLSARGKLTNYCRKASQDGVRYSNWFQMSQELASCIHHVEVIFLFISPKSSPVVCPIVSALSSLSFTVPKSKIVSHTECSATVITKWVQ